ncbi:L,D-transpeptidase family protein [Sphingorhabdus soli]|uniref:L,D-transpeptidase family protein n=2 Tax=Flavisphingopyxis soli TaxID=2601267 RepID=A0A5C6UAI4_9SPHN|nr:L,D-transpeptidase family protein [Sphingorhabdus soli]
MGRIFKHLILLVAVMFAVPAASQTPSVHPQVVALTVALDSEADPAHRIAIHNSIARWRAIEIDPNARYLLVNIPAFEISLWEGGELQGHWRAIVGKASTPTPEFTTMATGAIVNPWWNVPASIVRESVGRLVARSPREAARRGYVKIGTRYRQKPGPDNALGQMKLDMPNPASIGIHDTPSKSLFDKTVRSFSHGCIRVDDALGFAATLLGGDDEAKRLVDEALTSGETTRLAFDEPIPVVVGYFTAYADSEGRLVYYPDVYDRDRPVATASVGLLPFESECANG